jgi:hypothetical protein
MKIPFSFLITWVLVKDRSDLAFYLFYRGLDKDKIPALGMQVSAASGADRQAKVVLLLDLYETLVAERTAEAAPDTDTADGEDDEVEADTEEPITEMMKVCRAFPQRKYNIVLHSPLLLIVKKSLKKTEGYVLGPNPTDTLKYAPIPV